MLGSINFYQVALDDELTSMSARVKDLEGDNYSIDLYNGDPMDGGVKQKCLGSFRPRKSNFMAFAGIYNNEISL